METTLIGRENEQVILRETLQSKEPEMVAVLGRRRVGKTFLVRSVYEERIVFELTGIQNASKKVQLENFAKRLNAHAKPLLPFRPPASWSEAFDMLIAYLEAHPRQEKTVVFFDELPWLATRKSDFIKWLGYFWNSWATRQNVVVVICGSAASWMIANVVKDRGGLHNRVTKRIHLKPFSLLETKRYFESRNVAFTQYQIVQLYLAFGGIPHYLKEVKAGKSAVQNIDDLCFSETGLLREEFSQLYASLFEHSENHVAVIRALAASKQGLTRNKIIQLTRLPEGGSTTRLLEELEQSGFIASFFPFDKKKKDMLYLLTDEYSAFYLQFIENNAHEGSGAWQTLSQTPHYKTWSGFAFEMVCMKHIPQIKKALGIGGVYSLTSTFVRYGNSQSPGVQIDLLLDRNDQIINVFEIKFNNREISLTKESAEKLQRKLWLFQNATQTSKLLSLVMITTFGLQQNQHSLGLVQQVLTLDDLFVS